MGEHGAEFFHKVTDVLKFSVDRRESNKGDLINFAQQAEDFLADVARWDFFLVVVVNVAFDRVDQLVNLLLADRAFPAGLFKSRSNSLFVKRDA